MSVDQLAPGERAVLFGLSGAPADALIVELFPRGGRVVATSGSPRVVRAALGPPGGVRPALAPGETYAAPPAGQREPRQPHDLAATDSAVLATAIAASVRDEAAHAATLLASRIVKRLRGRVEAIARTLAECEEAPQLRRRAETLLAHLGRVTKGAPSARLPDVYGEGEIEIAIDPSVSPRENAERMFRRARKLERAEPLERERLAEAERLLADVDAARSTIQAAVARGELAEIEEAARRLVRLAARAGLGLDRARVTRATPTGLAPSSATRAERGAARRTDRFAPRRFRTSEGWEVLVGRTNEENDYLTHRLARPDDIWFHVHGATGSHVVLRRAGRKSNPSRRTVEEAASMAAFFSKARHASKAPVIYTEARYVRKPRGSPPGRATCTREKMVMVPPREPRAEQRVQELPE